MFSLLHYCSETANIELKLFKKIAGEQNMLDSNFIDIVFKHIDNENDILNFFVH